MSALASPRPSGQAKSTLAQRFAKRMEAIDKKYRSHAAFARPLRFGDPEQVAVLTEWRREIERVADEQVKGEEARADGMKRWEIEYTTLDTRIALVVAATREEAIEFLEAECDVHDIEAVKVTGTDDLDDAEGVEDDGE